LNIDWHTGIKIGAYFNYGGIRFYDDAIGYGTQNGRGNKCFSVAEGDTGVRAYYDMRSPIYYDQNNTGYYTDPNSNSILNTLTVNSGSSLGTWYVTGNGSTAGSAGIGMNVYSTGGNGAIMAFHRGGAYAVNMGLDSDNVLRIGGWSAAANRWQLDMSGNQTLAGGITATNLIGQGQTWQNVVGSRAAGTLYTNSTSRPITVIICCSYGQSNMTVYVDSVSFLVTGPYSNSVLLSATLIVPPGSTYKADSVSAWMELR
jgi:hypothetical protein